MAAAKHRRAARPIQISHIVTLPDDATVSEAEAAAWIGKAPRTLTNRRSIGKPLLPFLKVGGNIRYRVGTVRRAATTEATN
ncbi:hypothetical protein [Bosea sp. NBC_00550]|uniref:hypothetical protein n=1 Tax=Bosea sp. NBC_00550 TaxID=2969621 RepID=UPI0022308F0E|nr:hypothetical protein [Bosea sp. NBC_00550]UZF93013.1 hypothetical protein NWE53_02005 [Bosea sp. NBC_00550]